MTDKVRRRLVYKYTAIIAVMLLFFAVGGFAMCKYAVQKVIADTMYDAVAAEIREAEDAGVNENTPLKEMSAASDIGSIYSYAYWFAGDRLVFAEHPKDPAVDAVCRQKIAEPFADNKLQYFSLDDNRGRRWQFYMLAGRDGDRRVVILVNVTPFKLLSLRYIYLLLGALLLMLTVAWTGGNFLADRTIAPLIRTLENQKRFAADASHELRTPLAVLLSSLELLELQYPKQPLVAGMKEEVLGMSTLIGNLLELAGTDNRQPLIRRETFDLSMLADWAAAGMTGRRNVRVINGSAGAVPVSADREMIRRLLLILLDNAVKYSPENSQVTVRVLKEDKGCRIEVEDQGIGIDEKDIPHIFERFYRADKTRSRQTAGTGLGLSIAMEIAERHGGGIEVKSTPGKGSLFVVRLPDD